MYLNLQIGLLRDYKAVLSFNVFLNVLPDIVAFAKIMEGMKTLYFHNGLHCGFRSACEGRVTHLFKCA